MDEKTAATSLRFRPVSSAIVVMICNLVCFSGSAVSREPVVFFVVTFFFAVFFAAFW